MFLGIYHISDDLVGEAQEYFSLEYKVSLQSKPCFQESLVGRLKISQNIGNMYLPQLQNDIPKFQDNNYWSLSHKKELVFVGVSDTPIGVDIEVYKERDQSLMNTFHFEEYSFMGGKTWREFYLLWTIHESIIKYERETKYSQGMYTPISYHKKNHTLSGLDFQCVFVFGKGGKRYTISSGTQGNHIYSVCYELGKNTEH